MARANDIMCRSCQKRKYKFTKQNIPYEEQIKQGLFKNYWTTRNRDGTLKKGNKDGELTFFKRGAQHPNWKGGISRSHHTYRKDLGARKGEVIHHIDGDHTNNQKTNIIVFKNQSEHMKWHWKQQKQRQQKGRMRTTKNEIQKQ
jgi:hypothetical protein